MFLFGVVKWTTYSCIKFFSQIFHEGFVLQDSVSFFHLLLQTLFSYLHSWTIEIGEQSRCSSISCVKSWWWGWSLWWYHWGQGWWEATRWESSEKQSQEGTFRTRFPQRGRKKENTMDGFLRERTCWDQGIWIQVDILSVSISRIILLFFSFWCVFQIYSGWILWWSLTPWQW